MENGSLEHILLSRKEHLCEGSRAFRILGIEHCLLPPIFVLMLVGSRSVSGFIECSQLYATIWAHQKFMSLGLALASVLRIRLLMFISS